jgi:hypothetical protein
MGNEQAGLSEEMRGVCHQNVRLPMNGRADSLNLSIATGVMLYAVLEPWDGFESFYIPMTANSLPHVAVIGGGPAGLIAAEVLAAAGAKVSVFERKPNVGRKFLMAGRGRTQPDPLRRQRAIPCALWGGGRNLWRPCLENFSPEDLRNWCGTLGEKTFVGSSGRVFPESFQGHSFVASLAQTP